MHFCLVIIPSSSCWEVKLFCSFVFIFGKNIGTKLVMTTVTRMKRRLECKNLRADVLSRCGLIDLLQLHSELLHPADKSHRLCVMILGWSKTGKCVKYTVIDSFVNLWHGADSSSRVIYSDLSRLYMYHPSFFCLFVHSLQQFKLKTRQSTCPCLSFLHNVFFFSAFEICIKEKSIISSS